MMHSFLLRLAPQFGRCSVMIDLAQRSEPYEIALPYGLSVTVRPLTTLGRMPHQGAGRPTSPWLQSHTPSGKISSSRARSAALGVQPP